MAKQLNVNLAFSADTTKFKQQLQSLQQQLNNLTVSSVQQQLPITKELQSAQKAAVDLKIALQQSMNVETGKFDLSKFNTSLKNAGTSLSQLRTNLSKFGPEGQQAFMSLAQSIMQAEIPMRRSSALLSQLGTTLKNTAKWQISSSVLQGFMGAVQSAYGYAQDLNESLNNIRIVTGQNIDQMSKFADTANKAAKALSTSTTAYTDASLIYYQQGLNDAEVAERTEATVKLANVSRESAETVSEWMTAIWNNFDNGTRSLESYADVLTALGAATASSADEIAAGLEKFSAVADTVGLSYDYAASALATVTAETRQSADVVGTALRTLFARIEGLQLGETLDDGTTLNKYSQALATVGVNIKTASGDLKDMDDILNELGARWDTLAKDQQVALAQTVGGVRQYNTLISLMDNWSTFQENLTTAQTSEGALQEQADIYAESWEAAQKRVQAAAEAIYQDLLDDDFFIDLLNGFEKFLSIIDKSIDSMGGLKGVLTGLSAILLKTFSGQAAKGLENLIYNMKMMTSYGQKSILAMKNQAYDEASKNFANTSGYVGREQSMTLDVSKGQLQLQRELANMSSKLTQEEQLRYQELIRINQAYGDQAILMAKNLELAEKELDNVTRQARSESFRADPDTSDFMGFEVAQQEVHGMERSFTPINREFSQIANTLSEGGTGAIANFKTAIAELAQKVPSELATVRTELETLANSEENNFIKLNDIVQKKIKNNSLEIASENDMSNTYQRRAGVTRKTADELVQAEKKVIAAKKESVKSEKNYNKNTEKTLSNIQQTKKIMQGYSQVFVGVAQGISSLTFAFSSLSSMIDTIFDPELSGWEKFTSVLMSLSFVIPGIISGFSSIGKSLGGLNAVTSLNVATQTALNALYGKENVEIAKKIVNTTALTAQEKIKQIVDKTSLSTDQAKVLVEQLENKTLGGQVGIIFSNIVATKAKQFADKGETAGIQSKVAAKIADLAASASLLVITLAFIAALAILIGSIALIAAGIKALSDAYNADAIAAEKARKEANLLAEEYDKVKQSYEDLKQSIEDYRDAQNAIDTLKEGTEEWRAAIQEANLEIIELLQKYPELSQYVQTLDNGRMIISDEGINSFLETQAEAVAISGNLSAQANLKASVAENQARRTDLIRNDLTIEDSAVILSWLSLIGTGGIPGMITSGIDAYQTSRVEEFMSDLEQEYLDKGEAAFIGLSDSLKELGIESDDAVNSIQELIREQKLLIDQQEIIDQNQINNLLMAQTGFNSAGYTENMGKIAKELSNDLEAEFATTNSADKYHQYSWWNQLLAPFTLGIVSYATGIGNEERTDKGEQAFKTYMEAQGYNSENFKIKNFKDDVVVYQTKENDEWSGNKEVSYETLYEAELQQYLADNAEEMARQMNALMSATRKLSKSEDSYDQALASYLNEGDLSLLNPDIAKDLSLNYTDEKIEEIFNENQEVFKNAGIENAEELINGFNEALSAYDPEEAKQNLINQKWAEFNNTIKSGAAELEVSESALRAYSEILIEENKVLEGNEDKAAKAAVAHFRMAQGIKELREVLNDNIATLKDGEANSIEYAEALGAVKDSLDKVFGMNISGTFIKENLPLIEQMANGSEEAFKQVQQNLTEDFVNNLELTDRLKNGLLLELQELANQDFTIDGTLTMDSTSAIEAMNTALENGSTTVTELENLFANAGLQFDPGLVKYYQKPSTTTTTTSMQGVWNGEPVEGTLTNTVTSWVEMPWIGDNPPEFEVIEETGEVQQIAGTGTYEKVDLSQTGTQFSLSNVLGYETESASDKANRFKDLDKEIERYHEIQELMEDLEREADRLADAKDRAFGADKLALMDQEIAKQKELLEATKQQISEAERWYSFDRQTIIDKYGASLDESGRIVNFDELFTVQINALKGLDKDSDAYAEQEKIFEQFKEDIQQYEETLNLLEDEQQAVIDKQNELAELALEKIEYEVELKVKISDNDLKYLDYLLGNIEDDAFAAAESIALLGQKTEASMKKVDAYAEGIRKTFAETFSDSEIDAIFKGDMSVLEGKSLTEDQISMLEDYSDALYEMNEDLKDIRETVQNKLTEAFEAWEEKIDDQISKFDHYNNLLESYKDIIDVIGKDNLGISDDLINQITDAQINNARNRVQSLTSQLAAEQAILEDYKSKLAAATSEEDRKYWEESIKMVQDSIDELEENQLSSLSETLQLIADKFEQSMNQIADSFSESVSGIHGSIDNMRQTFDQQKELSELYLADYKKLYEISKLNREINKSIDATDNVKAQRELQGLAAELNAYQQEGVEMSEYDLEYLQKKYDLKLAEIALEEAQDAKNQVRLTRDSEGNWGYVYTADENTVADAQQKYEDAKFALDDLNYTREQELIDFWIRMNEEYEASVRDLGDKYVEGSEEYNRELELINQKYREKAAWALGEYQDLADNTQKNFNETYLGKMYPDYSTFEGLHEEITKQIDTTSQELNDAEKTRSEEWSDALGDAGLSAETLESDFSAMTEKVNEESDNAKTDVDTMSADMVKDIGDISTAVKTWQEDYGTKIDLIEQSNLDLITSIGNVIQAYQQMFGWAKSAAEESQKALESYNKAKAAQTQGNTNTQPSPLSPQKSTSIGSLTYSTGKGGSTKTAEISSLTSVQSDQNHFIAGIDGTAMFYFTAKKTDGTSIAGAASYEELSQYKDFSNKQVVVNQKNLISAPISGVNGVKTTLDSVFDRGDKFLILFLKKPMGSVNNSIYTVLNTNTGKAYDIDGFNIKQLNTSLKDTAFPSSEAFDTGGYTGSWGPEGRLAMLHQKELVLNAADTENMLSAIGILRSFSDRLEQNAISMSQGLRLVNAAAAIPNLNTGSLEQQIQITAQFPNATDRNEIEQAFINLANRASQYANRKF